MNNRILAIAAFFGLMAVILGAFGAHGLKGVLSAEQLNSFETGVKYQMYHAIFLLFLSLHSGLTQRAKSIIFYLIVIGTVIFSGSIYLLSTREATGIDIRPFGFITPIGGLLLILGWGILLASSFRKNHKID